MKRVVIIIALSFVSLLSCNDNALPKGLLPISKMKKVAWDIFQAEIFTQQYLKKDSLSNPVTSNSKLQNEIFRHHHITREIYYQSYNYYSKNPDLMKELMDSIMIHGEHERSSYFQTRFNAKSVQPVAKQVLKNIGL